MESNEKGLMGKLKTLFLITALIGLFAGIVSIANTNKIISRKLDMDENSMQMKVKDKIDIPPVWEEAGQ